MHLLETTEQLGTVDAAELAEGVFQVDRGLSLEFHRRFGDGQVIGHAASFGSVLDRDHQNGNDDHGQKQRQQPPATSRPAHGGE